MSKLHEIVAVVDGEKKRRKARQTTLYKTVQKGDLYFGIRREYQPIDDDSEQLPPENKKVQRSLADDVRDFVEQSVKLIDVIATKDRSNQDAMANIEVGGVIIASDVPVSTLLTLEKELQHTRSFFEKLPTLPLDQVWTRDEASDQYLTEEIETVRTKKEQQPIVLYAATDKHPAQTQLITVDKTAGHWKTRKVSSAIPVKEQQKYLDRIDALANAVKQARERANTTEVTEKEIGVALMNFIVG